MSGSESSGFVAYSMKAGNILASLVIVDISNKPLLAFSLRISGDGLRIGWTWRLHSFEAGNGAILAAFN